jgi:hypothetical protein
MFDVCLCRYVCAWSVVGRRVCGGINVHVDFVDVQRSTLTLTHAYASLSSITAIIKPDRTVSTR